MTPESRNNPLLDNGSLKHVSAATDKLVETRELLQIRARFHDNEEVCSDRGTAIGGHLYWILPKL
jgi:hypothetical protein